MAETKSSLPIDLRSVFLGPKGENADVMERLFLEAFRDHVFWRRNLHPEDGFAVGELDRHTPEYERSIHRLSQELLGLLGELKAGVPFFSPRYIGHMAADVTMASTVGYFAAMLYNPNNVSVEASPVTTRMELEVGRQLAAMVGYDPDRAWGHLTSGGTIANLEAMWIAYQAKYLPVAVRWAAEASRDLDLAVRCADGDERALGELGLWELLNVAGTDALDLAERFEARAGGGAGRGEALAPHSIAELGTQQFGRRLVESFGDPLAPAVVLVPSTAHYSWLKICRALGIGGGQLVHVPVDRHFRMDPEALRDILATLTRRRRPVLAVVSVLGTTEEGAVDRLDLVEEIRREAADGGLSCHLHADAAWGGYAISVTRGPGGTRRTYEETLAAHAPELWPEEGVYRALCAAEHTDSITIDPHKLGYVPYPAGALAFRDGRLRELVSVEAPYVFHREGAEWNIGRYILEGSKPGAAAAGVWMSHQVLPLDGSGYGRLIGGTARGALALYRRLAGAEMAPFRLEMLPAPDLNIVCFAVTHPGCATLAAANALAGRVYQELSVQSDRPPQQVPYFITKTTLRWREYGDAAVRLAESLGFAAEACDADGVAVLRATVMDPFLAERDGRVDHVEGFARTLRAVLERVR